MQALATGICSIQILIFSQIHVVLSSLIWRLKVGLPQVMSHGARVRGRPHIETFF